MLAVGRFAFLPMHRRDLEKSVAVSGPKTTGSTYFDSLQQEASFVTTTNDPAGFTIIDTLAWGALGHALGFAILASVSSGVIPGVSGQ
jgi:photosystem I subunit V